MFPFGLSKRFMDNFYEKLNEDVPWLLGRFLPSKLPTENKATLLMALCTLAVARMPQVDCITDWFAG